MRNGIVRSACAALAGVFLAVVWPSAAVEPNRVWLTDFPTAQQQAKAEGRFLVAFFYSPSSGICDKMQKDVLELSAVGEALEDFVRVRVNSERDRAYTLLYKVQQFPTVVFLDSEGRELDRFSGYADPASFLRRAAEAIDPKTNYVLLKQRLGANPGDIEALYYMGYKYTRRNDFDRAGKYFERVENLDKDNKFGFLDNVLLRRVEEKESAGDDEGALKLLEGFREKYKDSDELDRAELLRARLLWHTGEAEGARNAYQRFIAEFPESDYRPQAEAALQALSPAPAPAVSQQGQ